MRIVILATEASGDFLGSELIKAIRLKKKNVIIEGIGGPLMINSNLYAEEQIPDFPYDPEERATEMKRCASVCIRRQDICLQREDNSEE